MLPCSSATQAPSQRTEGVCGWGRRSLPPLAPPLSPTPSGPRPRSDLPPPGGQLQTKVMSPEPAPSARRVICGRVIAWCCCRCCWGRTVTAEETTKKKKIQGREIFHHPPFPLPSPAPAALRIRSPARGPSLRRGWGTQRRPRRGGRAGGLQPPGIRRHPGSFFLLLPLRTPPAPARAGGGRLRGRGAGGGSAGAPRAVPSGGGGGPWPRAGGPADTARLGTARTHTRGRGGAAPGRRDPQHPRPPQGPARRRRQRCCPARRRPHGAGRVASREAGERRGPGSGLRGRGLHLAAGSASAPAAPLSLLGRHHHLPRPTPP